MSEFMKKKLLIVGKDGFIGRNLCDYFEKNLGQNYEIVAVGRCELDVLDEAEVKQFLALGRYDVVIHSAIYNPRVDVTKNADLELENDLRMFFNFERNRNLFGKMLYFGSGAEFDKSQKIASVVEETAGNGIPGSAYGLSKYIIGKAIRSTDNIYNLRIFGLFGKYENWSKTFISGACCKAVKNLPITIRQNVLFDYLYIDDLCRIVEWFIQNEPHYQEYNVTTGKKIDLLTIAQMILKISGKVLPVYVCREGYANEYTANNNRLLAEIGEFAFTDMEKALVDLYQWYEKNCDMIDITSLLYQ